MLMLDVFCGKKGASAEMLKRGWDVLTVDIDSGFSPDVCIDVRDWHYSGSRPDLLWMSPPCNEFAREFMPWSAIGQDPDLSLYLACLRLVNEIKPRYWVIENVKGAIKYFGCPSLSLDPFFFWGFFPDLGLVNLTYKAKSSYPSTRAADRAIIPQGISRAFCLAIERSYSFFDLVDYALMGA